MKTVAFFSTTGGVGRTTLAFNLAWMMAERGGRVLAVDLDPQANLSSMFLTEEELENAWTTAEGPHTIFSALQPLVEGRGDVTTPHVEVISDRLGLIVGDPALFTVQDLLSNAWIRCHNREAYAFRVISAFHRAVNRAAEAFGAEWVLIDIAPNLGAINRSALIASEDVVIPLGPDLFSLQGLRNLGPSLRDWRESWRELLTKNPDPSLDMPGGAIESLGYVVMQHGMRENRPPKAYQRWIDRFPKAYRESVLDESAGDSMTAAEDPYCLATLNHYRSLMPMAMEARKPVFALKPSDGAIGAHGEAVQKAYTDFFTLARRIAEKCGAVLR